MTYKIAHLGDLGVAKNRGFSPKMDGENHGKPLLKWMIWGYPYFQKHPLQMVQNCLEFSILQPFLVWPFGCVLFFFLQSPAIKQPLVDHLHTYHLQALLWPSNFTSSMRLERKTGHSHETSNSRQQDITPWNLCMKLKTIEWVCRFSISRSPIPSSNSAGEFFEVSFPHPSIARHFQCLMKGRDFENMIPTNP